MWWSPKKCPRHYDVQEILMNFLRAVMKSPGQVKTLKDRALQVTDLQVYQVTSKPWNNHQIARPRENNTCGKVATPQWIQGCAREPSSSYTAGPKNGKSALFQLQDLLGIWLSGCCQRRLRHPFQQPGREKGRAPTQPVQYDA